MNISIQIAVNAALILLGLALIWVITRMNGGGRKGKK